MTRPPKTFWTTNLSQPASIPPIVVGNHLLFATKPSSPMDPHSDLIALDLESGQVAWQHHFEYALISGLQAYTVLTSPSQASPRHLDLDGDFEGAGDFVNLGIVATQSSDLLHGRGEVLAFDEAGRIVWQWRGEEKSYVAPVLAGDTLFTVGRMGTVYALDSHTLHLRWQQEIGNKRPLSQPAVNGDQVYVGFRHGLSVLDGRNGQTIRTFPTTRAVSAPPLILGDVVHVSCEDHHLYALDKTNGEELWRLEMDRRINVAPILTPSCLLVVDRGGQVIALEPPDLPEDVIIKDSSSVQMRREGFAQNLMERGEFSKAAEFWLNLGKLETAADAYEQAGAWQQAADLWQQLDRDGKRADALERHAQSLAKQAIDEEEKAAAWERAARAHAELRQKDARQRCEREAARYRRLPILTIEIEVKDLTVNLWSKLDFVVKNDGFGPARHVVVELVDDRFVGRAKHTTTFVTVMPDKQYANWLEVRPQAQGEAVPMQLSVEYVDRTGNKKTLERTFYLPVAGESGATPAGTAQVSDTGSHEFARLVLPDGRSQTTLRKNLIEYFSADELDTLCLRA